MPSRSFDTLPTPGRKTFVALAAALLGMGLCLFLGYFALATPAATPGSDVAVVAPSVPAVQPVPTTLPDSPTPTDTPAPSATFSPSPSATPSGTAVPPTFTPTSSPSATPSSTPSATASATPSSTPSASATTTPSVTPTFTPVPTPAISFTVAPNPLVAGQCATLTWSVDHAQTEYVSGGQFGAPPGQGQGSHSNALVCPAQTTTYVLRVVSGYGTLDTPRTLTVVAPTPVPPTILLDLVQSAPEAYWSNSSGQALPWNGSTGDSRGFAVWWQGNATLEDGSRPALALETHPEWKTQGWIAGNYPRSVSLRTGDRLRILAGFLQGGSAGNATYQLQFSYPCGGEFPCTDMLAQFTHAYNGSLVSQLISLSGENGRTGTLTLFVNADASSAQDWATWAIARIERP